MVGQGRATRCEGGSEAVGGTIRRSPWRLVVMTRSLAVALVLFFATLSNFDPRSDPPDVKTVREWEAGPQPECQRLQWIKGEAAND